MFTQYVVDLERSDKQVLCFVPVAGDVATGDFDVLWAEGRQLETKPDGDCLGIVFGAGGSPQDIQRWFEDPDQYFCYRYAMADHLQPPEIQQQGYLEPGQ